MLFLECSCTLESEYSVFPQAFMGLTGCLNVMITSVSHTISLIRCRFRDTRKDTEVVLTFKIKSLIPILNPKLLMYIQYMCIQVLLYLFNWRVFLPILRYDCYINEAKSDLFIFGRKFTSDHTFIWLIFALYQVLCL